MKNENMMGTRKLVLTALFIAISFIGANIKIAAGSIAFDSMAGFLGALMLGPVYGAIIGAAGHLLTAAISGFPFGLPTHAITMLGMAAAMYLFGITYNLITAKLNSTGRTYIAIAASIVVGVIVNGPVLLLVVMPILGKEVVVFLMPWVSLASLLNLVIAHAVYKVLPERAKSWK